MLFSEFIVLYAVAAASLASASSIEKRATRQKANEYKDGNCQTSSYGHNSYGLKDVTMDDSSNSVYLTIGTGLNEEQMRLFAFDGKSGNGGYCTGHQLGEITASGFCVDLNTFYPGSRIRCVRFQRA